jgi:single-strand selective monofunctional uracil DNA glycosylase
MTQPGLTGALLQAARELRVAVDTLKIGAPVTHVYNPLGYAWAGYEAYVRKFATGRRRVVFLGMNPGPFGMAQIGVPFGAIPAVRDWMKIEVPIGQPPRIHPKRPVLGFACPRDEVSGRRLYMELFAARYPKAEDFFAEHFVTNYCPLVFMTESGANFTPDKLPVAVRKPLEAACDAHLLRTLEVLQPALAIGVGKYAEKNLMRIAPGLSKPPRVSTIIHPAPASPIANREWPENPRAKLRRAGRFLADVDLL